MSIAAPATASAPLEMLLIGGMPLREPLAIFWDKRRPLPRYATAFCELLAEHMRKVFPITRPSESKTKVSVVRRGRSRRRRTR